MKRTFAVRVACRLTMLASFTIGAWGQVPVGTPPFGTFGGGPVDTINYGDLNVHIPIPVVHKPGRGIPFNYDLVYESSVWNPVTTGSTKTWKAANQWGWAASDLVPGYLTNKLTISSFRCSDGSVATRYDYSNWTYYDGTFTAHPFNNSTSTAYAPGSGQCSQLTGTGFTGAEASDSSGYSLSANGSNAVLTTVDGSYLIVPINPPEPSTGGSIIDRNGNMITLNYQTFTDTVGAKMLIEAVASPPGTGTSTYSYPPPSLSGTTGTVSVQKTFKNYLVESNFGCSGIGEYGKPTAVNVPLVDRIILADNTYYQFAYELTPGVTQPTSGPPIVTGRLASVTLPSAGKVSYEYTGGPTLSNGTQTGINCADGSAAGYKRTTLDGTWVFSTVIPSPLYPTDSATRQLTVVDPLQNTTVLSFRGIYETDRSVYQGGVAGANLLVTTKTCYSGPTAPTCGTPPTLLLFPITDKTVTTTFPGGLHSTHYDAFSIWGRPMETDDYDYTTQAGAGSLLKKIVYQYPDLGSHIHAFWSSVDVQDGAGKSYSKTTYTYDETARNSSPTPSTQWQSTPAPWGNLTSIVYSNGLKKIYANYVSGLTQVVTDVNGATTGYTYNGCSNSYVTLMAQPIGSSSLQHSYSWDCSGGVQTQDTEENGQTTKTVYNDPYFWRPASVTDPTQATTNFYYPSVSQTEAKLTFNSGSSVLDILQTQDVLGRQFLSQKRQGSSSTSYDTAETDYDGAGNPHRITTLYSAGAGLSNPGAAAKNVTRDALGRTTQITEPGGGTVTLQYIQNQVVVTATPAPSGEHVKQRVLTYDGLGRLAQVCEVTTQITTYPWPTAGCNRDGSGPPYGYNTAYKYDPLGNLTTVCMNAQINIRREQCRQYFYDSMSRLIWELNVESSGTYYFYDKDTDTSTTVKCPGTYNGDLVKRVDEAGNATCYTYDALHRRLSATYPTGPNAAATANKYFVYDNATVNGTSMANAKGRLAEAYTATTQTGTKITDVGFSYTVRGEISDIYQMSPNSSGYYHASMQYWENGATKQVAGLPTLPTLTYGLDAVGRINTVSASAGQNPLTGTTYNAAGLPTQLNFGSGDSDSYSYDPNTNRMTKYQFNVNGQSFVGMLTWNANGSLASQQITDPFNAADNQNCTYQHDDLSRILSVGCTPPGSTTPSVWQQSFYYDPFGNIQKSGTASFQPTYMLSTNRMTSLPGFTPSYDPNGNVLNDGTHTYTWDAEGKYVSVDGISLTYDALGRNVELGYPSEIFQLPDGSPILFKGQVARNGVLKLPGGAQVTYDSAHGGLISYTHADHLGSLRLATTPARGYLSSLAYAPFGEEYAAVNQGAANGFTGVGSAFAFNEYDFPARQYSDRGRWVSPDPAGLAAAHLENPQSWNRYAYVMNNPLAFTDPLGLVCINPANGDETADDESSCGQNGGQWLPDNVSQATLKPCASGTPAGTICVDSPSPDNRVNELAVWTVLNAYWNEVPWSATFIQPLLPFGPEGSAGLGGTVAVIPKSKTICGGPAGGVSSPAGGRSFSAGPLNLGNLNNSKAILKGWSIFGGGQATWTIGGQATANSSGHLEGGAVGTPGLVGGVSYSWCSDTLLTRIGNVLRSAAQNSNGLF